MVGVCRQTGEAAVADIFLLERGVHSGDGVL